MLTTASMNHWLRAVTALLLCVLALDYLAVTTPASAVEGTERPRDVRYSRAMFVDKLMPAAQASKKDARFKALGKKAQALWLTDYYSVKKVRKAARAYTERANKAGKTPVVALYAIPGRDCGLYSAGGFKPKTYRRWVDQVVKGLKDQHAIAVVEPDAVPFLGDCDGQGPRAKLLRATVRKLTRAHVWTYLDAGHEGWHDPAVMAARLKRSGIEHARGFSTNVGNYVLTATEREYAADLNRELRKIGIKGKSYLIETARNGAGEAPDLQVCNPPHARIGRAPKLVFNGALDGYVWIKHPGESDGECNGGPASGEWWPEGALKLLGQA